jgi:hypothetical protein
MYKKQIRLANTLICVHSTMDFMWGSYLHLFESEGDADVNVFVRYAEPDEDVGYMKIDKQSDGFYVAIPEGVYHNLSLWHILTMLPMEEILMERGTMILHANYVIHNGQAIIFSGPSGIGKSTQGGLWEEYGDGAVINGDRALLTPTEDGVQVDSYYLSGTSGICSDATAPLKAIVLLDQGPENIIRSVKPLDRFRKILAQLSYHPDNLQERIRITELLEKLLNRAEVIHYTCRKDESAVFCLKDYLFPQ